MTPAREVDEDLKEIVRAIFAFYQGSDPRLRLTRTLLEKSLWEFKVSLPREHPLAESFGFYWWLRGFYSDRLYDCIDEMLEDGQLSTDDNDLLYMPEEWLYEPMSSSLDLQRRIDSFRPSLKGFDPRHPVEEIILQHYNLYAPSQFCTSFPRQFVPAFERFLDALEQQRPLVLGPMDLRRLCLSRLDDATAVIPFGTYFDSFRKGFMEFRTAIRRAITYSENLGVHGDEIWPALRSLSEDYWMLFCMLLREQYHDHSVDYRMGRWRAEREELVRHLESTTTGLYDKILVTVGADKLGERLIDRNQLVRLVREGIENDVIIWVDTDQFGLGWEDLRDQDWNDVRRKLEGSPIRKIRVRYRKGVAPEEQAFVLQA